MPVKLVSNWAMHRLLVTLDKDSYLDLDFQGCQVVVSTPSTLVINLMRLKHQMVRSKLLQVSYHFLKLETWQMHRSQEWLPFGSKESSVDSYSA